jgi:hypothetical protein
MKAVRGTHFAIASGLLILFAACGGGSADAPTGRSDDLTAGAGPDVVVTSLDHVDGVSTCKVKNRGGRPTPSGISIGVGYSVDGVWRTWGGVKGPLDAGASVTIGTDGGAYTISNGPWGFDSSVQITTNNRHIHCLPGAVHDARNDAYLAQGLPRRGGGAGFFGRMLFSWQGVSGGGMDRCTYVGTNTGVYWNMDVPGAGNGKQPDANVAIFTSNSTGLRFENLVGLNIWADTFVSLSGNENYPVAGVKGTNDTVVTNVFTKNVWAYGAAIIFGHGNTRSAISSCAIPVLTSSPTTQPKPISPTEIRS